MIALSIRQPWAWLIVHAGKDIENRTWPTRFRGRVLVHASKGMTHAEYEAACDHLWLHGGPAIEPPDFHALERGGIVGSVELVDCVRGSASPWLSRVLVLLPGRLRVCNIDEDPSLPQSRELVPTDLLAADVSGPWIAIANGPNHSPTIHAVIGKPGQHDKMAKVYAIAQEDENRPVRI